jgi:hypothetical protein
VTVRTGRARPAGPGAIATDARRPGPSGARRRRLLAAVPALALAACAAPIPLDGPVAVELPPPIPDWVPIRLAEADDGRRIELARGASVAVALRAPASAGVGWAPVEVPAGLAITGRTSGPVWPPGAPSSRVAPAPVWQVFVFEARAAGEGVVAFALASPDASARARRVAFRVVVTG